MITIEVHNLFSKQVEDVRVYNDLPEKEREALEKMVLAKGKEQDFTICTLPMPINRKCLITDLIRPFVGKDGFSVMMLGMLSTKLMDMKLGLSTEPSSKNK